MLTTDHWWRDVLSIYVGRPGTWGAPDTSIRCHWGRVSDSLEDVGDGRTKVGYLMSRDVLWTHLLRDLGYFHDRYPRKERGRSGVPRLWARPDAHTPEVPTRWEGPQVFMILKNLRVWHEHGNFRVSGWGLTLGRGFPGHEHLENDREQARRPPTTPVTIVNSIITLSFSR